MNSPRNHNSPTTHELLSAYFDREATPEEAAEIERLLERSPEARQMLDDFAELSDLLHELPRHTLDASFANRVLQQARPQPIAASVVPISVSRRSMQWKWRVGLALATTAAAACVVVMVMLPRNGNGDRHVALQDAPNRNATDAMAPAPAGKSTELAETALTSGAGVHSVGGTGDSAFGAARTGSTSKLPGTSKPLNSIPQPADEVTATTNDNREGRLSGIQLPADVDLNEVAIGSIVEALQTRGDEVSMVKLTVVDVVRGLTKVQLLLANNSIHLDERQDDRAAKPDVQVKQQPGQLHAILVEAPRRQVEAVMAQLKEEWNATDSVVVGVRLEPAVDALAMNEIVREIAPETKLGQQQRRFASKKELAENRRDRPADKEGLPAPNEPAKSEEAKKSGEKPAAATRLAGAAPAAAARGSAGKPIDPKDLPVLEAKQYVLNVPQDVLERSRQRSVVNQLDLRAKALPRPTPTDEAKNRSESASAPVAAPDEETLQVLFVFEPGSGAAIEKARSRKFNAPQRPKKS